MPPEIDQASIDCACCGLPGSELDHLADVGEIYCPMCGHRMPDNIEPENMTACRVCGCTDRHGCPEGCWWVEDDLCSACVPATASEPADNGETPCPAREDGQHCNHWYDGEPCCACGNNSAGPASQSKEATDA